jgi:DinB superfamily
VVEPGERLTPAQIAALLRAGALALRTELTALPDAVLRHHPAPGEWCTKEVLGFSGRIRQILAECEPVLVGWDQEAVARERRDCERPLTPLLDEFLTLRDEGAALTAPLRPDDLARGGQHPKVGFLTVADLIQEWVHHDRNHFRQIYENVQHYVWPFMGNAQRFSRS